jgi:hypothetical protein
MTRFHLQPLLVFVLATLCWTKSLLRNVVAFTGMLLYPDSTLQLCSSRRSFEVFKDLFRSLVNHPDDVVFRPDAHRSATSVRMTRSFRPDAHQYQMLWTIQDFRFPVSRPDDVLSRQDAHLSIAPFVRTTCHTVRMLDRPASSHRMMYFSRLDPTLNQEASVPAYICSDLSASSLDFH